MVGVFENYPLPSLKFRWLRSRTLTPAEEKTAPPRSAGRVEEPALPCLPAGRRQTGRRSNITHLETLPSFVIIDLEMKELLPFLWNTLLYYPLLNLLIFFYKIFFSNLGLAVVALTLFTRLILWPLTVPMLKSAKKQRDLKPALDALKQKYKDDKKKLAAAQMELLQKHGINPMAGCLPQLAQILVLIALYQAFIQVLGSGSKSLSELNPLLYSTFLHFDNATVINGRFLFWDLTRPDPYLILPGLAGASQFWLSKMMLPRTKKEEKLAEKTADKKDDVMYNMQEQMLYLAPVMTVLFGWQLPSGLVLYWLLTTLVSLAQQWYFERKG